MEKEPIKPRSFVLEVKEYGETLMNYNDVNYDRFIKKSKDIVRDYMDFDLKQGINEVKNITFHFYTY